MENVILCLKINLLLLFSLDADILPVDILQYIKFIQLNILT